MKYTLPLPVIRYRSPFNENRKFREGEVLAFRYVQPDHTERTGIVIMDDSYDYFIAAVNLYGDIGHIWVADQLPDGIELYYAEKEERSWGYQYFLTYLMDTAHNKEEALLPVINYINRRVTNYKEYYYNSDTFHILNELPNVLCDELLDLYKKNVHPKVLKVISDTGLNFDKYKVELYCYFFAIICICKNTKQIAAQNALVEKLYTNWDHFSWMYGMALSRIVGSELKNFTAVINQLDCKKRSPYIHLYLPLIVPNIDNICRLNNVEKKYKLEAAIAKIRRTEHLTNQDISLDELWRILFPQHFQQMMQENKPAASIQEIKENWTSAMNELNALRLKYNETICTYEQQVADLSSKLKDLVQNPSDMDNAISFEHIEKELLKQDPHSANELAIHLNDLMIGYKGWQDFYLQLRDKIRIQLNKPTVVESQTNTNCQIFSHVENSTFQK